LNATNLIASPVTNATNIIVFPITDAVVPIANKRSRVELLL
jgi:hypothetical protein